MYVSGVLGCCTFRVFQNSLHCFRSQHLIPPGESSVVDSLSKDFDRLIPILAIRCIDEGHSMAVQESTRRSVVPVRPVRRGCGRSKWKMRAMWHREPHARRRRGESSARLILTRENREPKEPSFEIPGISVERGGLPSSQSYPRPSAFTPGRAPNLGAAVRCPPSWTVGSSGPGSASFASLRSIGGFGIFPRTTYVIARGGRDLRPLR